MTASRLAAPSRSRRRTAALAALFLAAVVGPLFDQRPARAASSTSFTIRSRHPIALSGRSYRMAVAVSKTSSGASLSVRLAKTAGTGNHPRQAHTYTFGLTGGAVRIDGSDLRPVSVDTGTQMGSFGRVRMHLEHSSDLTRRQIRCSNGTVIGSFASRTGVLSGSFTLHADDGFFRRIHKTGIGVSVEKLSTNGRTCAGAAVRAAACDPGLRFRASQPSKPLNVFARRPLSGPGRASLTLGYTESDGPATITHTVTGIVPLKAVHVSSTKAVTIAGGSLSPFARGTIHFAKVRTGATTGTGCRTTRFPERYASGSVTARFDSRGYRTMDGADFAKLTRTFTA